MTSAKQERHYDKEGNLLAYKGTSGCNFGEILAVRIEERMGRIESNIGDSRIEIRNLLVELNDNKKQISIICSQWREGLNEFHINLKRLPIVMERVEELNKRVVKVERHANVVTVISKIGAWVIGLTLSVLGLLIGVIKIKGGN